MRYPRKIYIVLAAIAALALFSRLARTRGEQPHTRAFFAMDTPVTLTAYGPLAPGALESTEKLIRRIENEISVTVSGSAVARLNAGEKIPSDGIAGRVLAAAFAMRQETDGAFDPTLYPALLLWGFTSGKHVVPSRGELDTALRLTGPEHIKRERGLYSLDHGSKIDLGGIGKGWASDAAVDCLRAHGVKSAIVNLGGNVRTLGFRPDGSKWRVGVRDPESGLLGVVTVGEGAVITSGNYERFFEKDGVRYWHILDPHTGEPARSGSVSVTVTGESGTLCDALSTALFVMGPEKGAKWLRSHPKYGAVILGENGTIFVTKNLAAALTLDGARSASDMRVIEP